MPTSQREFKQTRRVQFWQSEWKLCCHKSKKIMFQVRVKGKLTKFQKNFFIRNMILWRHKVQLSILISLPKTFPSSTVNVRSEFWKFFKKKRFFKCFIFCLILRDEDCKFHFWYPCRKVFRQARLMFVQSSEEFEKKTTSKSLIFLLILWDENCNFQFWYPCPKLFRQARYKFVQSSEEID